jgi:ribonuclease VapC
VTGLVIDTSALVAVLMKEPEGAIFKVAMLDYSLLVISAASLLETRMVLHGRHPALPGELDALVTEMSIVIEPVTARQSDIAFDAFRRYGKGMRHRAGLNFGECFAYALAIERDAPLLFKGNDFVHTDVKGLKV